MPRASRPSVFGVSLGKGSSAAGPCGLQSALPACTQPVWGANYSGDSQALLLAAAARNLSLKNEHFERRGERGRARSEGKKREAETA